MTQAGDLKFRLAFESRPDASDEYGGSEGEFAEQFRRWAKIEPRFLGEQVLADRLSGRTTVLITVPNDPQTKTIAADWRARDVNTGTLYDIKSVIDPDMLGQWIECLSQTGGAT